MPLYRVTIIERSSVERFKDIEAVSDEAAEQQAEAEDWRTWDEDSSSKETDTHIINVEEL